MLLTQCFCVARSKNVIYGNALFQFLSFFKTLLCAKLEEERSERLSLQAALEQAQRALQRVKQGELGMAWKGLEGSTGRAHGCSLDSGLYSPRQYRIVAL